MTDPGDISPAGWKYLRLVWCDAAGIRRCRVVPAARFGELCRDGLGVAYACMFLPSNADTCPPDPAAAPVGEMRLVPALDTLRVLPWHPSHALALATAHTELGSAGPSWECCPRSALARVLAQASQAHGITIKAGFESEFMLLDKSRAHATGSLPPPLDESLYCQASALDAAATVLDAMCDALAVLGMDIVQLHAESGHGQYEIATVHAEAMQACDNLMMTRETITAVAVRHGLAASFLPKLRPDEAGNGCHCHFSIWQDGRNLLSPPAGGGTQQRFSVEGEAFLAGVLHNLPALLCFTAPSPNSYWRLQPSTWSGAFQVWGVQNREAALRICSTPGHLDSINCELKAFDASANPYLGLAAVVVAGMEGIQQGLKLPAPLDVDPGSLDPAELTKRGIRRLPEDLGQAMAELQKNTGFRRALDAALGPTLVRAFLAVRHEEWKVFGCLGVKEQALALATTY